MSSDVYNVNNYYCNVFETRTHHTHTHAGTRSHTHTRMYTYTRTHTRTHTHVLHYSDLITAGLQLQGNIDNVPNLVEEPSVNLSDLIQLINIIAGGVQCCSYCKYMLISWIAQLLIKHKHTDASYTYENNSQQGVTSSSDFFQVVSRPITDECAILSAFCSASSNRRPTAITSPTLFIELPICNKMMSPMASC